MGTMQQFIPPEDVMAELDKIAEDCNNKVNAEYNEKKGNDAGKAPSGKDCTQLGTEKHKCCEDEIKKKKWSNVESEVPFDKNGKMIDKATQDAATKKASDNYFAAKATAPRKKDGTLTKRASEALRSQFMKDKREATGLKLQADVVVRNADGSVAKAVDFKFNCGEEGEWGDGQQDKYREVLDVEPDMIHKSWNAP